MAIGLVGFQSIPVMATFGGIIDADVFVFATGFCLAIGCGISLKGKNGLLPFSTNFGEFNSIG